MRIDNLEDIFLLTPLQQGMLFHTLMEPESGVYFVQFRLGIEGNLDAGALQEAWQDVTGRHAALRTEIHWQGLEKPVQVVYKQVTVPFAHLDWRGLTAEEREARFAAFLQEDRRKGFQLTDAPLMRLCLLRFADEVYRLVWSSHHLLMDGWSMPVVIQEVLALYQAKTQGREVRLTEARSYGDYIRWLRQQNLEQAESYWRSLLQGFSAPTPLPLQKPAAEQHSGAFEKAALVLSVQDTERLQSLARRNRVTLGSFVQAAWGVLLARYSGEDDVVFGVTVSGRPAALQGVESMVGMFINSLPMRVQLAADDTVVTLVRKLRDQQVDMGQYEYSPLVQVQKWSALPGGTQLFDTLVVVENYPLDATLQEQQHDLGLYRVGEQVEFTNYGINLQVSPADEVTFEIHYDGKMFARGIIEGMLGHLQTILLAMIERPEAKVAALPLLSLAERQALLASWQRETKRFPQELCLQELFEAQVSRTPERTAVRYEGEGLTYAELNERANRLARYLQQQGAGPEQLVGLAVERSLDMVVGILGILKAGAAYVPLDPSYPQERLAFLLEDAGIGLLVTQSQLLATLPATAAMTVCLDRDAAAIGAQGGENLEVAMSPDHLAYIIYTSGSTGHPKGVLIPHRNVGRLMAATERWYGFDEQDVWTLFHSYAFDFSVWELWGALLYGGKLVVVPYLVSRSPEAFCELLRRERVTVLNQTPSAFRQLIAAEEKADAGSELALRYVIFGGEALELQSLKPWFARHGDQQPQLVNMYGITETTVHVTYRPIGLHDVESGIGSVIGEPIPDLELYVLDANLQPVPPGVRGELYVGGAGLARGYLNRPDLTAERFLAHPFSDDPAARLYKTGDLARYLPNGELEYQGRIDHQVKVRGFRIELGEIEAALAKHAEVRAAVVIVREDAPGDKRLVAYLVLQDGQEAAVGDLRAFLQETLPDYMVPSAFVFLPELPLTANGKTDTQALPAPNGTTGRRSEYAAPENAVQEQLAAIWAAVLGVGEVGIDDNYFELGGDSILSIRILSQATAAGLPLTLQDLFRYPTIRGLAAKAGEGHVAASVPRLAPFALLSEADRNLLPDGVADAYPLTKLQAGMLFHSAFTEDTIAYHNVTSYKLRGELAVETFQRALERLLQNHAILRTSFDLTGYSEPLQLVQERVELPLRVIDLRERSAAEQELELARWQETELQNRFDWSQAPLLRVTLHLLTDDTVQFGLTEHHAILDGWSVASLLTELFRTYAALLRGEAISDPPLQAEFRDYVALEQQALRSEASAQFWQEKLAAAHFGTLPRLPLSMESASRINYAEVAIPEDVSERLKEVARTAGVPVKSILLAAHLRVMSLLTGQPDVVTGLVAGGRTEAEDGERTLGLFLNTLPLRLTLAGGTWLDLVRGAFEAEQELLPHRRYPMAQVQQELGGQPLFEAAFNFTHFHVYEALQEVQEVEVVDFNATADTNFAFGVECSQDLVTAQLKMQVRWDASEFAAEQMQRVAGYYEFVLRDMAQDPANSYEKANLLSYDEHSLLRSFNETMRAYDLHPLHRLIEAQVARTPQAEAVVFQDSALTYADLNARANRLASTLQEEGVTRGHLVGVAMERSLELVISLLAILKAGGAYVPLDPEYPAERLAFLQQDAAPDVVLTQSHLADRLPAAQSKTFCVDLLDLTTGAGADLVASAGLDDPAYMIYTSGSTGKPKGVLVPHRGIANRLLWMQEEYRLTSADRVLQKTPFSFDVSVWEFFWPLMTGAALVVAKPGGHGDSRYLLDLIKRERITTMHFVPSMLQLFLEEQELSSITTLRQVMCSGEALPFDLQEKFYQKLSGRLHNLYGPTEASVDVTYWECEPGSRLQLVPIGRPVANTALYVLDEHLMPVPVGVPGELFIGGEQLAIGYHNRPELTAERFLQTPYGRLYKTGDLARWLPGGALEYLGRLDFQVKIRGFRIELGEIESVLLTHPAIRETVVTAHEQNGDKRLVAYVVPAGSAQLSVSELRDHLQTKLAAYMVPSAFVVLDRLPLSPNGKVDRKALPKPEQSQSGRETPYVAPRSLTEQTLAGFFSTLLGVEQAGVQDDFFQLGGHSLLALRLMALIEKEFARTLPLSALFEHRTVEKLARLLGQHAAERPDSSVLVPLQTAGDAAPLFLIHAVGGSVLSYIELADQFQGEMPVYALQAPGLETDETPLSSIPALAARYAEEIVRVQPHGPYRLGGWSFGGAVAYELAAQLKAAGQEIEYVLMLDTYEPRDGIGAAEPDSLLAFAADLAGQHGLQLTDEQAQHFRPQTVDDLYNAVTATGLLPDLTLEQFRRLFNVFRANRTALQVYRPAACDVRVELFQASEHDLGWQALADVRVTRVDADHYSIIRAPHVQTIVQRLSKQRV
ncbi:amino acid adenylation domain-containing protein [Tumebacillus sp. BK434]|uniref:amino acid adenylation domain-containing protein n=1 Tax=Tumebacillus sp. BK434 TaxID=2512169 RepID=UPI00104619E4|nr:non-ribosomal peptide synthetase [Tumebacillus sp. BK434]TCP58033.1 amino acid adenylation domain-containing protein [Tumebacillus sp. BK434]